VVDGPEVVEAWAAEPRHREKGATRLLRDWIDRGLEPSQIIILSPNNFDGSLVNGIDRSKLPRQVVDVSKASARDDSRIRFSTIAGFKGLESDAVLLVDINDLASVEELSLLYVGASRAKSLLGLVLD